MTSTVWIANFGNRVARSSNGATIGCEPYAAYDGGDHLLILGRVAYLDCQAEANPLLFYRGGYGSFT